MLQGSSALRPTNGLYLYYLPGRTQNFVLPHLEQEFIEVFQHGDAVVPLNNFVRAALNGKFPVYSVGRGRLVSWTPKSSDLMPVGLRLRGI